MQKNCCFTTVGKAQPSDTYKAAIVMSFRISIPHFIHVTPAPAGRGRVMTQTTLFAIKGSNNKKTKQRKRSEINHCKISQTQHISILGLISVFKMTARRRNTTSGFVFGDVTFVRRLKSI